MPTPADTLEGGARPEARLNGDRPLRDDLAGLDALELTAAPVAPLWLRAWRATWPKLGALALGLFIWQAVVWSGWKDEFLLPPPAEVFSTLGDMWSDGVLGESLVNSMNLAVRGYLTSVVAGTIIGALVARVAVLRAAFGSLITGIQTMPSVAWVPWAILLFKQSDATILFVILLGTTPAVANGLIIGSDQIPPTVLRAGRVLGARGLNAFRYVILPASLPGLVGGLKQGWAFAWRSLMAGEIIVLVAGEPTIGGQLQIERGLSHADGVMAMMLVILAVGIIVDALVFATLERRVARRWGLVEAGR
jgi:NitT/TauT family transport system permease protein